MQVLWRKNSKEKLPRILTDSKSFKAERAMYEYMNHVLLLLVKIRAIPFQNYYFLYIKIIEHQIVYDTYKRASELKLECRFPGTLI